MNPADILGRGIKIEELNIWSKWWKGLDFLSQSEEGWPLRKVVEKPDNNVEMKTVKKSEAQTAADSFYSHAIDGTLGTFVTAEELSGPFTADPHHFSSWLKLKRVTAWIIRFINNCQK